MRLRSLILTASALLAGGASALAASTSGQSGLAGVQSAGLVQNGRVLDWTLSLAHGLPAGAVATGARQECLRLETRRRHVLLQTVCLSASGHPSRLGLTQTAWHGRRAGATRRLSGTVIRSQHTHTVTASFSPAALGLPYRSLRWQVQSSARGARCPVTATSGAHHLCTVLYPATRQPVVAMHTPKLVGCSPAGPSLVDNGPSDRREIALAFDDGPWNDPPTIDFVNELKRLGVVGTFFEIGDQISEFDPSGSIERAMLADGDMIGNHTWTHPNMLTLSPAAQTSELEQTSAAIRHATGFTPCLWRPPYGSTSPALESLARKLGMLTIYWDIDPRDWSLPGTGTIVATVLQEARDGGITEMHFGGGPREETLNALPQIVARLEARGYRFVNLVQMLGLHEIWQ